MDRVCAASLAFSFFALADARCTGLEIMIVSEQGPHLENAVPTNGTLDQKEFLADDFRINAFKVGPRAAQNRLSWGS